MSKPLAKVEQKKQIIPQHKDYSPAKSTFSAPSLREVNVPATHDESHNVIAVYKDLNQPLKDFANLQQKHLFIGFFVFIVLGLGIVLGQKLTQSRGVASPEMAKLIPAGAETSLNTHYHYDKSCYLGENGEQVCMTRTSEKRR